MVKEHVRLVNQGKQAVAHWKEDHPDEGMDLRDTTFNTKELQDFNFDGADFRGTDLSRHNLSRASLKRAILTGVNLDDGQLIEADLTDALSNSTTQPVSRLPGLIYRRRVASSSRGSLPCAVCLVLPAALSEPAII